MEHKISKMGVTEVECSCGWKADTKNIPGAKGNEDKMLDSHSMHQEAMERCKD